MTLTHKQHDAIRLLADLVTYSLDDAGSPNIETRQEAFEWLASPHDGNASFSAACQHLALLSRYDIEPGKVENKLTTPEAWRSAVLSSVGTDGAGDLKASIDALLSAPIDHEQQPGNENVFKPTNPVDNGP